MSIKTQATQINHHLIQNSIEIDWLTITVDELFFSFDIDEIVEYFEATKSTKLSQIKQVIVDGVDITQSEAVFLEKFDKKLASTYSLHFRFCKIDQMTFLTNLLGVDYIELIECMGADKLRIDHVPKLRDFTMTGAFKGRMPDLSKMLPHTVPEIYFNDVEWEEFSEREIEIINCFTELRILGFSHTTIRHIPFMTLYNLVELIIDPDTTIDEKMKQILKLAGVVIDVHHCWGSKSGAAESNYQDIGPSY